MNARLLLVALLVGAPAAFGQSQTTGTILGTVTDPTGASVPNAEVVLKNLGTGAERAMKTDADGRYLAPLLDVGLYNATVGAPGFSTMVQRGLRLTLGATLTVNVPLTVAAAATTVEVEARAAVVETTNSQTAALVNSASVSNLPLNGRRFLDLASLTPGVMVEPERNQLSFAGSRGVNTAINIDGTNFNEPFFGGQAGGERSNSAFTISQAAVDQFQVVRGVFDPEFGRTTAGSVNVITKSGSNDFHGEGFYFLRHKEFAPATVLGDRVAATRQQFGAAVGGPLVKDKLFFFGVYDGQREKAPTIIRFSSTAGLPDSILSQQGTITSTNTVNTYLAKADWQIAAKHRLSLRYNQSGNTALNGTFAGGVQTGVPMNNGTEKDFNRAGVVNMTSALSPTRLNELRFQYRMEDRPRVNNGEGMDFVSKAGPQTQISGCCYLGGVSYLPIPVTDSTTQLADSFSIIRSGHSIKFGFDYTRARAVETFRGNWRGVYIFNNIQSFLNVTNGVPGAVPDQFRIFYGDGKFDAATHDIAFFAQDSWRINRRVTLTGGLRYEAYLEPTPPRPNPDLPLTAQVPSDKKEFQPRLGLAIDLTGDTRTVLRLGAGLFYAQTPGLLLFQAFNSAGNPNVGISFTLNPTQIAAVQKVHPEFVYPFVPLTANAADSSYFSGVGISGLKPDASYFSPDFRNPRSLNFTAGLERQITNSMSVSLDWVHVNTVYLERIRDTNLFPPTPGLDNSSPAQMRPLFNTSVRPNTSYGKLLSQQSSARANYDGTTLSVNKRLSHRVQFMANYTLAYNRDSDSNERNYAGVTYQDATCLVCEFTWARGDIRHRAVISGIYELPLGFQISGIMNYRSGLPFTAFTGVDSNRDGNFTDRPYIGGVSLPRNSFRQPNFWNTDLRVSKRFRIAERHTVEFLADLFNVFDHTNWFYTSSSNESSTTAVGSRWGTGQTPAATFRTIRLADGTYNRGGVSVSSPFQLQVGLRYLF